MRHDEMLTAKEVFKEYHEYKRRLNELEYQLASIDDDVIQTTSFRFDKVKVSRVYRLDERVYNRQELKERLEQEIYWTRCRIERIDLALESIGQYIGHNVLYLKRRYIEMHSISKIARDFNTTVAKVNRVLKRTEELFCYIVK